ncbi:hypothetical protein Tco_1270354 [Tanacetum coccineum]
MVNDEFIKLHQKDHGVFLPYGISDHSPSVLIVQDGLIQKLKKLKKLLRKLSWNNGNVHDRAKALKEDLKRNQEAVDNDPFDLEARIKAVQARRNKNRVERIKDENGMVYEGSFMAEQFVLHFKKFLGESKPVQHIDENLSFNKISEEHATKMTSEVTSDEIKDAIFDIDSNKAYGPDGYSYEFFKKAWDVIGNDVCLAVKEFFRNGKILGECYSYCSNP